MVTGAFSPDGERNAGQEVIAEASDAQEARIALFSETVKVVQLTVPRGR
jgi:hypothetical protein